MNTFRSQFTSGSACARDTGLCWGSGMGVFLIRSCAALVLLAAGTFNAYAAAPEQAAVAPAAFESASLVAVDGAGLLLQQIDGGFARQITRPGDAPAKTIFRILQGRFGTVVENGTITGLFAMDASGITTEYADGRSELLLRDTDAVSLALRTANGEVSCATWYPAGHQFTAAERKAALAQYARRLGLTDSRYQAAARDRKDPCASAIKTIQVARPAAAHSDRPQSAPAPAARSDTLVSIMKRVLAFYTPEQASPGWSGFERFYTSFLAAHEGGYAANDGNNSPANFGVNQGANPDVDVVSLTRDVAKQLLYERYWLASGADKLPPALAAVHGDTAVNLGVRAANDLLAQSGGDPARYLDLRETKYLGIAAVNEDKAKYLPVWLGRNDDLRRYIGSGGDQDVWLPEAPDRQILSATNP